MPETKCHGQEADSCPNVIFDCLLLAFRILKSDMDEEEALQNDSGFLSEKSVEIEKKILFSAGRFALFLLFSGRDEEENGFLCGEK